MTYLFMHFRDDTISLQCLSKQLNVSVNYLGALFQSNIGKSFREYLNMLRLKYSCGLLLSSELSVKEVAYASGYKTNEHFLRTFRSNLNMTPTEYRRNVCDKLKGSTQSHLNFNEKCENAFGRVQDNTKEKHIFGP